MKRQVILLIGALALAACGVDGEPVQPTMDAGIGISSGGGVQTRGNVGLHQGPVSLYLGL